MQEIADYAKSFEGTEFHHQGRRPGVGLDCAGIVICAAWQAGVSLDDVEGYGERPEPKVFLNALQSQLELVDAPIWEAEPGYIVAFWVGHRERVQHLGVVTGEGRMVCVERHGEVEEVDIAPGWLNRVHSIWRVA